jgi:hypothetical protein
MEEEPGNQTEPILAGIHQMVEEAKAGNAEVLPELRRTLDQYPEIWRHHGDLAKHTEAKWLTLLTGQNACTRESIQRTTQELRESLLEAGDSPLERLLVDRIVVSRLMVAFFEASLALAVNAPEARSRFLQQQLDRAQRRHETAVKSLAETRKLLAQT